MFGQSAFGEGPFGEAADTAHLEVTVVPSLAIEALYVPDGAREEGTLVAATTNLWTTIVEAISHDWSLAHQIPAEKWEEIVAGGFKKQGYDEVILTPRSGDFGRDVIAIKRGFGCIKVLGSVKAYAPHREVPYDSVRAFLHSINAERDTSKGIISTTSKFPPKIMSDPFIAPYIPTRLELWDREALDRWFKSLLRGET